MTRESEHLRLGISKRFYTGFPYLSMVSDPPGKALISNSIVTFVCDSSDNGVT